MRLATRIHPGRAVKLFLILLAAVILLTAAACGVYFFFVDTLWLTEITGDTGNGTVDAVLGLVDFDTGITRYEMFRFRQKSDYYVQKMSEARQAEGEESEALKEELKTELVAEPVISKLMNRKFFGIRGTDAYELLQLLT